MNDLVIIELDKPRVIKFNRKALKIVENIFKCKIVALDPNQLGIDEIVKLLHCGLLHEDESLKLKDVEDLVDNNDIAFGVLLQATMKAFEKAFSVGESPKV